MVADSPELLRELDRLVSRATQHYPVSRRHRLEAHRIEGGAYRLHESGQPHAVRPDWRSAARTLFWRMHELALDALPEFTRIHAGCATWNGRRLVAAGSPNSGKSTLMTRLLYEGFHVHCDELVLLRDGEVLPYPRRLLIRRPAAALIPQLPTDASDAPEWEGGEPGRVAVDPSTLGFEWRIERAPADAVLLLELDPGGPTRLDACPKHVMAERLMFQSSAPAGGPGEWAKAICSMLDRARCFVLRSGSLDGSVAAVKGILS